MGDENFSVEANEVLYGGNSPIFRVFDFGRLIVASQLNFEIRKFADMLTKFYDINKVLEVGTCGGGTLYVWAKVAKAGAKIITIDLPDTYEDDKIPIFKSFGKEKKQDIHLVRSDSHSLETLKIVTDILNGDKLDLLFIDGDHSYEGAKKDFELYSPLVRKGGVIGMHDIVPIPINSFQKEIGVHRFWDEIKNKYDHEEIIEDAGHQRGYGIGLLKV